jgi:hypothetical protein
MGLLVKVTYRGLVSAYKLTPAHRQDPLLQESGYRVLRFLAEDAGRYLDQALDAILRALSHQDVRISSKQDHEPTGNWLATP